MKGSVGRDQAATGPDVSAAGLQVGGARLSAIVPHVPRLALDWLRHSPSERLRLIDGTMVFVDVSGFTSMSERLGRQGRVGAEEVTDVIGDTFDRLLSVAYAAGGALLKFGGDALLLFFHGDDHVRRGVHAAYGMRGELRRIGRISTSAGYVTLRMSVGVHTGTFHFFLVGDAHRELLVTGPAATRVVDMEGTADAGEVVLSAEVAAELDPALVGTAKGDGFLLKRAPPAPPDVDLPADIDPGADLAIALPDALRSYLLAGGEGAEHRQVSVAFLHFDHTDDLVARDAVTATEALHQLVTAVQSAAQANDVTFLASDIDHDGGKIILASGTPRAHEDQEERLLRAIRIIADAETTVDVRIGAHRGAVFAGEIGPFYRRTYTIMGDAVNTTARIMAKAEPGQVLVTPELVERSTASFHVTPVPPFHVKGKREPLEASLLGAAVRGRRDQTQADVPLVGREAEMERLDAALSDARRGTGRLVVLVGEAGVGKSRLVDELTRPAGVRTITAWSERYETDTPYFAARQIVLAAVGISPDDGRDTAADALAAWVGAHAAELAPWVPLVADVLDVPATPTPEADAIDPRFRRDVMHDKTVDLLSQALTEPTVLVLEDAEWMDEATQAMLSHLADRLDDRPWLVIVARRDVDGGFTSEEADTIAIEPLGPASSIELAREASIDLLPEHASALAERSGGNPFMLQQLVAHFSDRGDLESLPDAVETVVAARIDALGPTHRRVLRNLSVLGRTFDVSSVEAVLDEPAERPDWDALADFVEPVGEHRRFRQALYREVAYEGLPYRARRALHERAAHWLERYDAHAVELLSTHSHHASLHESSWHYSRDAAVRANAKAALAESVTFRRRALAAARRLEVPSPDVATEWEAVGDALVTMGQRTEAVEAYRAARRLAGDDVPRLARLCFREGQARSELGRLTAAVRWYLRGLRLIEGRDGALVDEQRARLLSSLASVRWRQGRYRDSIAWADQALATAERADDVRGQGVAHSLLYLAHTSLGSTDEFHGRRAVELLEACGHTWMVATALNNLATIAIKVGRWSDAVDLLTRSRSGFVEVGDAVMGAAAEANLGELLTNQGRLPEARRAVEAARRTFRAARSLYLHLADNYLGRILALDGEHEEADTVLERAARGLDEIGMPEGVVQARLYRAEAALHAGRLDDALELLGPSSDAERFGVAPMWYRVRGFALLTAGRLEEAIEAFETGIAAARAAEAPYEEAHILLGLARARDDDDPAAAAKRILDHLGVAETPAIPSAKRSGAPTG